MQPASNKETDSSQAETPENYGNIILRNQKLECIHKSIVKFGPHVSMLDLSGNLIKKIDIDSTNNPHSVRIQFTQPFYSMTNLKILDLSKNHIEVLHPNLFEANSKLTVLFPHPGTQHQL